MMARLAIVVRRASRWRETVGKGIDRTGRVGGIGRRNGRRKRLACAIHRGNGAEWFARPRLFGSESW